MDALEEVETLCPQVRRTATCVGIHREDQVWSEDRGVGEDHKAGKGAGSMELQPSGRHLGCPTEEELLASRGTSKAVGGTDYDKHTQTHPEPNGDARTAMEHTTPSGHSETFILSDGEPEFEEEVEVGSERSHDTGTDNNLSTDTY